MIFLKLFFCLILFVNFSHGLEIDEKLTLRLLKVSRTKKTVLINRGLEDGLVVGDHAKFYLTTGVVARGVMLKGAPTRSIWSVYRLVNTDKIVEDRVLNLKITTPVKVTKDETKMIYKDASKSIAGGDTLGIPIAPGANDLPAKEDIEELDNIKNSSNGDDLFGSTSMQTGVATQRTIEIYGTAYFSSLASSLTQEEGSDGFDGTISMYDFILGVEKYFSDSTSWLHKFSIKALLEFSSVNTFTAQGDKASNGSFGYGGGLAWHFYSDPLSFGSAIGFINLDLGLGTVSDTITIDRTGVLIEDTFEGAMTFFSLGIGAKYFLENGFGARLLFEYYRRGESFVIDDTEQEFTKVTAGPRFMIGLGYRF